MKVEVSYVAQQMNHGSVIEAKVIADDSENN